MRNVIIWNGISSDDLGLIVEKVPSYNRPRRKVDVYNVPGRNGDIVIPQDAWENIDQSYEIWGGRDKGDAVRLGYEVAEWLYAPSGYQKLEDTYDPEHYRLAYFPGPFDVDNWLQRQGRAIITFNCDPRRFINDGEIVMSFTNTLGNGSITLVNPSPFTAKPWLSIHLGSQTSLKVNGTTVMNFAQGGRYIIDCDKETVTDGVGDPASHLVSGKFPVLGSGTSAITVAGMQETENTIIPRWWTL